MSNIQSISLCCPPFSTGKRMCINDCETCTAKQHTNPYRNLYAGTLMENSQYWNDVVARLNYARERGVHTLMLTGSNEPQQNKPWIRELMGHLQRMNNPFINIEIQTTGAKLDYDYLLYLKKLGVTTVAVSTFNIFDDSINREIEHSADSKLNIQTLCDMIYNLGMNIRICLNITDHMIGVKKANKIWHVVNNTNNSPWDESEIEFQISRLLSRCAELHANQVTFRKMWSNPGTKEATWIDENCQHTDDVIAGVNATVVKNGRLLEILPYGAARYDYDGFSIVIDTDSMSQDTENTATKYFIIREDGHMYSMWDSKASLIF